MTELLLSKARAAVEGEKWVRAEVAKEVEEEEIIISTDRLVLRIGGKFVEVVLTQEVSFKTDSDSVEYSMGTVDRKSKKKTPCNIRRSKGWSGGEESSLSSRSGGGRKLFKSKNLIILKCY